MGRGGQALGTLGRERVPTAEQRRLLRCALSLAAKRAPEASRELAAKLGGEGGLSTEALAELVVLAFDISWPREYLDQPLSEGCEICDQEITPMQVIAIGPAGELAHDRCAPPSALAPQPLIGMSVREILSLLRRELANRGQRW